MTDVAPPAVAQEDHAAARPSWPWRRQQSLIARDWSDTAARVMIGGLFLALSFRIADDFLHTGRITGLLLLASELLVVVLTLVRRPAAYVDRAWDARLITALAIAGPLLVSPTRVPGRVDDVYTATLSACGLLISVAGKLSLRRSFGLLPAHRGLVSSGLYRFVRHPIYAGYLVTDLAFLVAHATAWNAVVLVVANAALLVRAVREEQTLSRDPAYVDYRDRVRWRVAPGVF